MIFKGKWLVDYGIDLPHDGEIEQPLWQRIHCLVGHLGPRINHRLGRTYDQDGSTLYQQGLGSHTFPRSLVVASLF